MAEHVINVIPNRSICRVIIQMAVSVASAWVLPHNVTAVKDITTRFALCPFDVV